MEDNKDTKNLNEDKGETQVSPVSFHNLYKHLNISVKTLDYIIVVLIVGLIIALFFALQNRGFYIEFDSQGGTSVETQKHMHGETIEYYEPERQGYSFDGWAYDADCKERYVNDTAISSSFKLYACWIEKNN